MVAGDRFVAWLILCLVGGFCVHMWYWYVRSIIFYVKNGFDFSEDFGPAFYWDDRGGDDNRLLMKPKEKFLFALPSFVVVTSAMSIFLVLGLTGII